MTTFEKLMQDEDFKQKFREGYKEFLLEEKECYVKRRFNFNRKELFALGHKKLQQLYEIIKDWDFHSNIYFGYYERPIEGYDKSLLDTLVENENLLEEKVKKHIKDVYEANEARTKRMREREEKEFKIYHSKEEQEYNLYCNLLDILNL